MLLLLCIICYWRYAKLGFNAVPVGIGTDKCLYVYAGIYVDWMLVYVHWIEEMAEPAGCGVGLQKKTVRTIIWRVPRM